MRHERIPIEQKLRGDKCEPCTPAHGMGLNESHAPERVSMNAASTSVSVLRNGSGNEMDWLMGEEMDDPLSSLLDMEQEAQEVPATLEPSATTSSACPPLRHVRRQRRHPQPAPRSSARRPRR